MSLKSYSSMFPLSYCAARFLRQWESQEKQLHEEIRSKEDPSDSVRRALAYFQIARNFKGLGKNKGVIINVCRALIEIRNNPHLQPEEKVNSLAMQLGKSSEHANRFNLSAATKLLWLSSLSPYVIYDNRAVVALGKNTNYKNIKGNYENFVSAWRKEYQSFSLEIEAAVMCLPEARPFMPHTSFTDVQLCALSKRRWFKERVFDIFLWEVGGAS